jgi:predicted metal-dependent phosphoesterase TrpH
MIPTLRADLHVHSCHSKVSGTLSFLGSRDCYSKPADVYCVAKARGMDLVAFTDHDSIGGALELLNDRPDLEDVIVGEEVSCRLPDGGLDVHLGVYGMTEALHRDLQPLRGNVFDVIARLREAGVHLILAGDVDLAEHAT